jgi:hypothetical protein
MIAAYKVVFTDEYLEEAQRIAIAQNRTLRLLYQSQWVRWGPRVILALALIPVIMFQVYWGAAIIAFPLLMSFLQPIHSRRSLARARRSNPVRGSETSISMNDGGLDLVSAHSHGHTDWAGVMRVTLYSNGVLLELQPRRFVWLPDQCLIEGTPEQVRSSLSAHVAVHATVDHAA